MSIDTSTPGVELPAVAVYVIRATGDPNRYETPALITADNPPAAIRTLFLGTMPDLDPEEIESIHAEAVTCAWFALCENDATRMERGPIGNGEMGDVPICQRCTEKINKLKES